MSDTTSKTDWDITNIPPPGHKDVAEFAGKLFELALAERDRMGLPARWLENHRLYRRKHKSTSDKNKNWIEVNLYFANVNRTVANITARDPVAEVIDMEGRGDDADTLMTVKMRKWWNDSSQPRKLKTSAQNMEIYGITPEKPYWNNKTQSPDCVVLDAFAWLPAPGIYEDISSDAPYICHIYPEVVEVIEKRFNVKGISADDAYSTLGQERDKNRPITAGTQQGSINAEGNYAQTMHPATEQTSYMEKKALLIEVWVRESSAGRNSELNEKGVSKERDGVRKITICQADTEKNKHGWLALSDSKNPNLNPAIPDEFAKLTHAWGRFPFYYANSYSDSTSIWGFSAAEQVSDLQYKIDEIISRMVAYIMRVMSPPFICPQGYGISKSMLSNRPGLILMPSRPGFKNEAGYLPVPSLPTDFFRVLDLILGFFDRVYQIEDADRGVGPTGVIAASAIVALQERNAVLIQEKIKAVDYLVSQRGRWAMSMYQNFGTAEEFVEVNGEQAKFRGVELADRNFNYVVESGSTMPRTSLQLEEQTKELYKEGAIDRQALLENINYPGWKEIIERVGEGQLGQAIQILIQAGLPEEMAAELYQMLMQPQGGPGNREQTPPKETPPKAQQGEVENASV